MALIPKKGSWIIITKHIPVAIPIDIFSSYYAIPTGKLFWKGELETDWINHLMSRDYHENQPYHIMQRCGYRGGRGTNTDFESFKTEVAKLLLKGKTADKAGKEIPEDEEELVTNESIVENIKKYISYGIIPQDAVEQQLKIKTPFGDVYVQPFEYRVSTNLTEYIEGAKSGHSVIRYMSEGKNFTSKIADQVFYIRSRGITFSDAMGMVVNNIQSQNNFYLEMNPEYQLIYTRDHLYFQYLQKKITFCKENNREDLLDYGVPHYNFAEEDHIYKEKMELIDQE